MNLPHHPISSIPLSLLISKSSLSNLILIAQFLPSQTIKLILDAFPHFTTQPNLKKLLEILFVKNFTHFFIHQTDKSTYLSIYDSQKFTHIQNHHIKNLWLTGFDKFHKLDQTIIKVKKGLTSQLSDLFDVELGVENIFQSFNDPMPPELNLRKSQIGTYCNSSFQFYLIAKRFPSKDTQLDQPFFELKENLQKMRDELFEDQGWEQKMNEQTKEKIMNFAQFWYKVDSESLESFLIPSKGDYISILHNSMVYIVTLFDVMIEIIDEHLASFSEDDIHEFIEFSMRFAMLRNSLLELEKQVNFLFSMYNQIVKKIYPADITKNQIKAAVDLSVWRCLLSKWYLYMKKRHDSMNTIYCFLFKKINYAQFCSNLKQKQIELNHYMISLENGLQSAEDQFQSSEVFFILSPLMEFIEEQDFVIQLLKEYVEYIVDISINEDSVHWCGHSDHEMHVPYQEYSQTVVEALSEYLEKIYKICQKIDKSHLLFSEIINKILHQMDKEYLKPLTLKKLISSINQKWGQLLHTKKQSSQTSQICSKSEISQLSEFGLTTSISFTQRDQRIQMVNCYKNIPSKFDYSRNIVIQSEDFNSFLKRSANTNYTQSGELPTFEGLQIFNGMTKSVSINCDF